MRGSAKIVVAAVASRDPARAAAFARDTGVARVHPTYDALLADPAIEAVYVPLANALHAEWAQRAAAAGKHVLCEKPLATSAAEARAMVDAAKRHGVYLVEACIVGPGVELKTSFVFRGSKIAHLSFVGDSILGEDVNIEAGAMLANYRNELADKQIRLTVGGAVIDTGVDKFGALVGDGARIGANAVLAPGTILAPGARVGRLELVDQRQPG